MIRNENFILIQGFMINELKLKGNELLIYAIISGFCQEDNQRYTGSLQYLADWTNSTKQGVIKNLKSLIDKGLIEKNEKHINGVKFCEYHSTKFNRVLNKVEWGIKQSLMGGIKQSLPNNIYINNIDNNIDINNKKKKKETEIDLIINEYSNNEYLKNTIYEFIKMRKAIKAPMTSNALKLMLNKLNKLAAEDNTRIKILEQSIMNSWKGIFELKDEGNIYGGFKQNIKPSENKWDQYDFE